MKQSRCVSARISTKLYLGFEDVGQKLNKNLTDTLKQLIQEGITRHLEPTGCLARVDLNDGSHCLVYAPEAVKLGDGSLHDAALICAACKRIDGPFREAT
jgi:hypothetical protein